MFNLKNVYILCCIKILINFVNVISFNYVYLYYYYSIISYNIVTLIFLELNTIGTDVSF